jgi:hypothetical protein
MIVVVQACNFSSSEAEEGELPVQGQPELHSKILSQKIKRK